MKRSRRSRPPGRHDAGHRAGERRKHGYERPAAQAHADHQTVHQVGLAGDVSAVFQDGDEEKEDGDLRQEGQHASHAADHAVDQQAAQGPFGHECPSTQPPQRSMPWLIRSISGLAQEKTA